MDLVSAPGKGRLNPDTLLEGMRECQGAGTGIRNKLVGSRRVDLSTEKQTMVRTGLARVAEGGHTGLVLPAAV